uniref:BTB domain-containing protein n=1 Tax=Caenorhabditis tropicalis TaxID=1561998 RepID=A0A1I7UKR4_9PELO
MDIVYMTFGDFVFVNHCSKEPRRKNRLLLLVSDEIIYTVTNKLVLDCFSMVNHIFQLLTFHSPFFASENYVEKNFPSYCDMYDFLQFAHGVRYKIIYSDLKDFFVFAKKYQLPNVTQLLEQKLILEGYHMNFKTIFAYDLNHQLAMRLKRMKNSKELAEKLKTCKIEKMSGEAIKQCVKFFFEH